MTISTLPTPPSRADSATFADRSDAFLLALPNFAAEANATVDEMTAIATAAAASADAAAGSATVSGATIWVSGTTYTIGQARFSPINFQTYRRKTAGAGTIDPSTDTTNWARVDLSVLAGGTLLVANGGTGATTALAARVALGVAALGANADVTSLSKVTGIGNNATTHIQITAAGLVGIGALPSYKFDVVDTATATVARFKTSSVAAGASASLVVGAGATNQASLTVDNATLLASLTSSAALGLKLTAGTVLSQYAGTTQDFYTAGVKRMSLDASGNVNFQTAGSSLNNVSAINGGQLAGFRNRIINGAFLVAKYPPISTFPLSEFVYVQDRWYMAVTGSSVNVDFPGRFGMGRGVDISGLAGNTKVMLGQRILSTNAVDLQASPCTLSANMSLSATGTVSWSVYSSQTAPNEWGVFAAPARSIIAFGTFNVGTGLTNFFATFTPPSSYYSGLCVEFSLTNHVSGIWHVDDVQLEPGMLRTPFEKRGYEIEVLACEAYYKDMGVQIPATASPMTIPCTMRFPPTVTLGSYPSGISGTLNPAGVNTYTSADAIMISCTTPTKAMLYLNAEL